MKLYLLSILLTVFVLFVARTSFDLGVKSGVEERCSPTSQFELGFTLGKMFVAQPVRVEMNKNSYMRNVAFRGPVEIVWADHAYIYDCDFECVVSDPYHATIPLAWGQESSAAINYTDSTGDLYISGGSIIGH